jgi:hypothetical protein
MKKLFLAGLCALCGVAGFAQERKFYFDIGIGSGFINYGKELNAAISDAEDAGLERMLVFVDMALGIAVTDNLFIVESSTGFGDTLSVNEEIFADYFRLSTYLFGLGVKFYPLPQATRLQIGADAGLAWQLVTSTIDDYTIGRSPFGFGGSLSVSYDFDSDLTGPAFLIGAKFMAVSIENEPVTGFALFAKFAFKTSR